ncbi:MAG: hypothetical protein KBD63_07725 [Bacteriovoracaceae bacterium]|jgi:hypothetical protein|nr:hypothetical protein [Bacteriovoracaceae bacterium]
MRYILLILIGFVQISYAQVEIPAEKLKEFKKIIEENNKNNYPNSFPDVVFKSLKITTPVCNLEKLEKDVSQCVKQICFTSVNYFAGTNLYSEFIIHGSNDPGVCTISHMSRRYFVSKKDLPFFAKIYLGNMANKQITMETTSNGSKHVDDVKIDGKSCKIKSEYINEVDPSNTEVVKFNPSKEDGTYVSITDGKNETYYTAKGKTYRVKSGELNLIPRLVHFELEKDSISTCKDLRSTFLYELQKQGAIVDLPMSK